MADKQYEYVVTQQSVLRSPCNKTVKTIWFRSTNYIPVSPYGWSKVEVEHLASDAQLVKIIELLTECEVIPARYGVSTSGMSLNG